MQTRQRTVGYQRGALERHGQAGAANAYTCGMNAQLHALFEADQAERQPHPDYGTAAYLRLRVHDAERRARVQTLLTEQSDMDAEDWYHAALIFQHGDALDEIWQAHILALRAAEAGFTPARWLAAAALDRWLMYQGQPQRYGTQFVPDGTRFRLWDVDPAMTDSERAAWDVPSLARQIERAEEMSLTEPQPPVEDAPWWLKEALRRWNKERGLG